MNYAKQSRQNMKRYRNLDINERAEAFEQTLQELEQKALREGSSAVRGTFASDWKEYLVLGAFFAFNAAFLQKAKAAGFPLVGLYLCTTTYDYNRRFNLFLQKIESWVARKVLYRLSFVVLHDVLEDAALLECVRSLQLRYERNEEVAKEVKECIRELDRRVFHRGGSDRSTNEALNLAIRNASQLLNTIEMEASDRKRHIELCELFGTILNFINASKAEYRAGADGIEIVNHIHGGDPIGLIKQRIYAQEKKAEALGKTAGIRVVRRLE